MRDMPKPSAIMYNTKDMERMVFSTRPRTRPPRTMIPEETKTLGISTVLSAMKCSGVLSEEVAPATINATSPRMA